MEKFSKGRGYKDTAFVKALAALELSKTPEAQLEALAEVGKQAHALRKACKADKDLTGYLDDVDKVATKERKLQELQAKKASQQQASDSEAGQDLPALLTAQVVPLLRQVPKGETMHALIALAAKDAAVLVSRRPVAPARRKLLADFLGASAA